MKATRADVARMANVSTATVTYVLNKSKNISPETTARVMQAVETLNYRPDYYARAMSSKKSMQLGVLIDNISNPFYGDIIRGFETAAADKGYFVNVFTSVMSYTGYFANAIERRLDGMFIASMPFQYEQDALDRLLAHGIRIITSGFANADLKRVCSIENDYVAAMREAMQYLYGKGHRDIAHITGLSREHRFDARVEGYLQMVNELKLPCGDSLLYDGRPPYGTTSQDGYELTAALLSSGKPVTAIIAVNDLMAFGAYVAIHEKGLRIPEDIAVIGFDDIMFSTVCSPPLTTMSLDKVSFGQKAFELLYANMTRDVIGFYRNQLHLVERQSTNIIR